MSLKQDQVSALALELNRHLTGQFLSHCVQIDLASFSFSLSQSGRIVFVLDNPDPYLYVSDTPLEVTSLSSNLSRLFRKRLARAEILSVEALHEDRIIGFTLRTINDVFKEEILTLIVELIPAKANLILLDETKKVLAALRTNSITDKRPIFPGVTYTFPASATRQNTQKNAFVYDFYVQKCLEKEPGLYARRKKERFKNLFALLSRKKKSAERKIKAIEGDMAKAKEHLNDGEYGNFIYLDPAAIHPETGSMDYYGTPVPLDPRKSVSGNATAFFARAKKAKATLSRAEANLAAAEKERDEAILALSNLDDCDESALEALAKEYGLDEGENKKKTPLGDKAILPYAVEWRGVRYLFGRNATMNDFLSFLYATNKTHIWMHVKDNHGAHLILQKANPTDEELQIGLELTLLASSLEQGEVMYTAHKNVRRGQNKGQAIVKEYQSAYIKSVSKSAKSLFECAKKIKSDD